MAAAAQSKMHGPMLMSMPVDVTACGRGWCVADESHCGANGEAGTDQSFMDTPGVNRGIFHYQCEPEILLFGKRHTFVCIEVDAPFQEYGGEVFNKGDQ